VLNSAPHIRIQEYATPGDAAGQDEVLLGRIREDATQTEPGLALWTVNDNLRKGAALNAIQIAELVLAREPVSA
jgi:aspartate-semialdehyde dehydrogenase